MSSDAEEARQRAAEERAEAEASYQEELPKLDEAVSVFRRLRDHSRADTFTAMIQHEFTRREDRDGV